MSALQQDFFERKHEAHDSARPRPVLPSDVDAAFVARSVAVYRANPDARYGWRRLTAEDSLRESMAERMESIRAIDLVYGDDLNDWAAVTREDLWREYFTAEAILRQLSAPR